MNNIPIIIMTRNDGLFLNECVDSIIKNTEYPYNIYIIDNNSSDSQHLQILEELSLLPNVSIFRNKNNLWVLGVNKYLEMINNKCKSPYFVLTDGDIKFPNIESAGCWLTRLVSYMIRYQCVGKIGISLNWELIESDPFYEEIYNQEKRLYHENKKIGELFISPVDTTAAIYRWDWSISGYKFYPDHIRYLRPELYSCRTPKNFNAFHLGWLNYKKKDSTDIKKLDEKIKCFTIIGADLKKTQIAIASNEIKFFNKIFYRPMKVFWSLRRIIFILFYTFRKGIRCYDNH
ncbi:glycosyltransferase family 2 protein [Salmonella enterica]|nr:glycosyltransferase family 2 protein [Salmonella enterica subsp. diarizonae]EGQ5166341.1 glycosyltransferase family 2 protein [Salmonella enterica]HCM1888710.1 glycosyltransferase family 2 protein [Salmonella enterica subsp. diarizonae serovar 57:c:z]HCM1893597.1 glycosyltransferase family 2 protein [Salmonella enterica subsp. diarizonae serovar 57:c:e,n,x,z15]EGV3635563.1 glycosyltransferase family 2 protein [Salmonella enterica]